MSRSPSHLTGGIVWKNISGHHHIAVISDENNRGYWKLPVVKQDPYKLANSDPFGEIALLVGAEVKDPLSADTVFYPDNDPPEYAIFWHLRVKPNSDKLSSSKKEEVRWVSPAGAVKMLARESEKKLIRSSELPSDYYDTAGGNITLRYSYSTNRSRRLNSDAYQR